MPALPLDEAGKYVAGAYVVFLTLIIVYIAILGAKISRIERQVIEVLEEFERGSDARPGSDGGEPARSTEPDAPREVTPK